MLAGWGEGLAKTCWPGPGKVYPRPVPLDVVGSNACTDGRVTFIDSLRGVRGFEELSRVSIARRETRPLLPWYRDTARWKTATFELSFTAALMVVYFYLRGQRPDNDIDAAVSRSLAIVHFEQRLGIFAEVRWQSFFLPHETDDDWFALQAGDVTLYFFPGEGSIRRGSPRTAP